MVWDFKKGGKDVSEKLKFVLIEKDVDILVLEDNFLMMIGLKVLIDLKVGFEGGLVWIVYKFFE